MGRYFQKIKFTAEYKTKVEAKAKAEAKFRQILYLHEESVHLNKVVTKSDVYLISHSQQRKFFKLKNFILTGGILFITLTGYSQHRIGDFLAYGNNNGLPASLYYSVCQSSDGYLWIGSSSGLVRFDGKRYEIFFSDFADTNTIADNVITDLVEDNNGNLWLAGFYQGISKYNLQTGKVKRYPHPSQGTGHAYGVHRIMKDQQGHIWVGTKEHGLGHYIEELDRFEYFFLDTLAHADLMVESRFVSYSIQS